MEGKAFWDAVCHKNARWVCCPMCDLEKCEAWSDKCDAQKWYEEHIHDYVDEDE